MLPYWEVREKFTEIVFWNSVMNYQKETATKRIENHSEQREGNVQTLDNIHDPNTGWEFSSSCLALECFVKEQGKCGYGPDCEEH